MYSTMNSSLLTTNQRNGEMGFYIHRSSAMAWSQEVMRVVSNDTVARTLQALEGEVQTTPFFHSACEQKLQCILE